jgi:hypothetical protein
VNSSIEGSSPGYRCRRAILSTFMGKAVNKGTTIS